MIVIHRMIMAMVMRWGRRLNGDPLHRTYIQSYPPCDCDKICDHRDGSFCDDKCVCDLRTFDWFDLL